ncbi:MAG TPA: hypothetical protein VNZ64_12290 [Candidatus Acidoferrum sp.]|nr:hypothetical protein [Candidatus Acidoferrum sp.]
MAEHEIGDGTWTCRVTWHKDGVWRIVIFKPSVNDSRFRRARFVLVDGPTILVPGEDLRRVVEQRLRPGKSACPLSIDPVASTINKQKVQVSFEN